jgi:hypothetical protein
MNFGNNFAGYFGCISITSETKFSSMINNFGYNENLGKSVLTTSRLLSYEESPNYDYSQRRKLEEALLAEIEKKNFTVYV